MKKKQVSLSQLAEELGAYSEGSIENLKKATANALVQAIPMLVAKSPVDTGLYAQSWDFTIDETMMVLGNYAPYAGVIEYGARPFTPPIGPLLGWAKRVLKDPSQPPSYSDQVWALAKGVQKKISAVGMQPRNVMESTIPEIIENIKREYKALNG